MDEEDMVFRKIDLEVREAHENGTYGSWLSMIMADVRFTADRKSVV